MLLKRLVLLGLLGVLSAQTPPTSEQGGLDDDANHLSAPISVINKAVIGHTPLVPDVDSFETKYVGGALPSLESHHITPARNNKWGPVGFESYDHLQDGHGSFSGPLNGVLGADGPNLVSCPRPRPRPIPPRPCPLPPVPPCPPPTPPPPPAVLAEPGFRFARVGCRFYALGTAIFNHKRDAENLCNAIGGTLATVDHSNSRQLACDQVLPSIVKHIDRSVSRRLAPYYMETLSGPVRAGFICELRNDPAIIEQRNKVVDLMATNPCQFTEGYWNYRAVVAARLPRRTGPECRRCRGPCDRNRVSPINDGCGYIRPAREDRRCRDSSDYVLDNSSDESITRPCRPCERLRRLERNWDRDDILDVNESDHHGFRPCHRRRGRDAVLDDDSSNFRRRRHCNRPRHHPFPAIRPGYGSVDDADDSIDDRNRRRRRCPNRWEEGSVSDTSDTTTTWSHSILPWNEVANRRQFNPCNCNRK